MSKIQRCVDLEELLSVAYEGLLKMYSKGQFPNGSNANSCIAIPVKLRILNARTKRTVYGFSLKRDFNFALEHDLQGQQNYRNRILPKRQCMERSNFSLQGTMCTSFCYSNRVQFNWFTPIMKRKIEWQLPISRTMRCILSF